MLSKLRHYIPFCVLINIYNALIKPYLSYGLISWSHASKTHLNKLTILQKRALRLIHFADRNEHAIPLFVKTNVLPLSFLYVQAVSNLMYDINTKQAPSNILNLPYNF